MDNEHLVDNLPGLHGSNYRPVYMALGAYNTGQEWSKCEVSELIYYNRILPDNERSALMAYLNSKYNLNGGGNYTMGPLDTSELGERNIYYWAEDKHGNETMVSRTVIIVDQADLPVITLNGEAQITHGSDQPYVDAGVVITDAQGNLINEDPVVSGVVDHETPGEYFLAYDYEDADGNPALTILRTIAVVDKSPPVITLHGGDPYVHQMGNPFVDPGGMAMDIGDGEVQLNSSILTNDSIRLSYFIGQNNNLLDLTNGGGLLGNTPDIVVPHFVTAPARNAGLYMDGNPGDYPDVIPDIPQMDNFMLLFEGYFRTKTGGLYEFGIENPDDRGRFYLDLDQDGVFEMDGDRGPEQMNALDWFGYREIPLEPGFYKYAVVFLEGGGGQRIDARYRAIEGAGPPSRTRIFPGSPDQKGQWVQYQHINTLGGGEYDITYTATDSKGNSASLTRNVIVKNQPEATIITLLGDSEMIVPYGEDFTDPGSTLTDIDGNTVIGDVVVTGEVDTMEPGEYELVYNFTNAGGFVSRQRVRKVMVVDNTPPVITLGGAAEITHFQGTPYTEAGASTIDDVDGVLIAGSSHGFKTTGMIVHLDASSILGIQDGDPIYSWRDISGEENHATDVVGIPTFSPDGLGSKPAVYFDGFSSLALPNYIGPKYSIFTVSRLAGGSNQRLLSSKDIDWVMGYDSNYEDFFRDGRGDVTFRLKEATTDPHLYSITSENRISNFYANGILKSDFAQRRDGYQDVGRFQMGAWRNIERVAKGYVAEVIVYDHALNDSDRKGVEAYLSAKYGLNGVPVSNIPVNPDKPGEYHVVYEAIDSSGNRTVETRKVTVVPNPNAPSITLTGGDFVVHEAGEAFTDPGFELKDTDGNTLDANLVATASSVNDSLPGLYTITYNYIPNTGLPAPEIVRQVLVQDSKPPVITLNGEKDIRIKVGETYTEAGATALDTASGEVLVINSMDWHLNALLKQGFTEPTNNYIPLNLDSNGGLLSATPIGSSFFTDGPTGRGMEFGNNTQFWSNIIDDDPIPAENYQFLWSGVFIAPVSGGYEFGIEYQDDRSTFFVDLDQDGIFEVAQGERLVDVNEQNIYPSAHLDAGIYKVAIAFAEGGGGERVRVRFSMPPVNGKVMNREVINPADPGQFGLWAFPNTTPIDTSTASVHTVEYIATDEAGNIAIVERTIHVVDDDTVPFISLNGDPEISYEAGTAFTDPGATVTNAAGVELTNNLQGVGTVDTSTVGEYTLTYDYNDSGKDAVQVSRKVMVVDTTKPTITLNGDATMTITAGSDFTDPGVTATDAAGEPLVVTNKIPHKLHLRGYLIDNSPTSLLDFHLPGSLFDQTPEGSDFLTKGPGGRGWNVVSENEFLGMPIGITRNDWYQTLVTGYFHAKVDGDYTFQAGGADNHHNLWLDLNQNGIFEMPGGGLDERLFNNGGTKTLFLQVGYYRIAFGFLEYTGGARSTINFQTPIDAGPSDALVPINPASPAQAGLWFVKGHAEVDTTFTGTYPMTYYAIDGSGNVAKVDRTVIVEPDPNAPVLHLVGDAEVAHEIGTAYTDELPEIKDQAGQEVAGTPDSTVTLDGAEVTEVDGNVAGIYQITYTFTDGSNRSAIPIYRTVSVADTTPPVITLVGDPDFTVLLGAEYKDAGATVADAHDQDVKLEVLSSKPTYGYVPGLLGGTLKQWSTGSQNPGNYGIDPLGPTYAQVRDNPPWENNIMVMYTGEIYDADGVVSFREYLDEWARVEIGGQLLFDDHDYNSRTEKSIDLGQGGWFPFDLRMWNGGGGGGGRVLDEGIQYDPEGGVNWLKPENTSTDVADLFRYYSPLHDTIDAQFEGEYTITYSATDASGNTAIAVRTITVKDDFNLPVITLVEGKELIHEAGEPFVDPGATVANRKGETFDATKVVANGTVDVNLLGTYEITYDFTDDGLTAPTTTRRVTVVDTTPPEIALTGGEFYRVDVGANYSEPGVEITDNLDTGLVANVQFKSEGRQPILHWEFDQDSGTVLKELMNNLDGTLKSFPDPDSAWVAGKYGKALKFDASTGNYVEIPATDLLDLQAFTISMWVNSSDYNFDMYLFEKTTDKTVNSQFNLSFRNDDTLYFKTIGEDASVNDAQISSSGWLTTDEWVHLAVTYDGVQKLIYVNSELAGVNTHDSTLATNPGGLSYIGANAPGDGSYFHGLMDDLKVYDAAVPENEINDIASRSGVDTSMPRKDPPFRFLYTVTDSNGNTATIERKVVVSNDSEPPVLTLQGLAQVDLKVGDAFVDEKALAIDQVDGNLSGHVVITGEVDTSKVGVYELTYDVMDTSYNSAPSVTRTVTVSEDTGSPLDVWIEAKLSGASADDKKYTADPDKDGLENLLEYALDGNPSVGEQSSDLIAIDSSGSLKITFKRLKASVGANLTYKVELATDLVTKNWNESAVTVELSAQQDDLQGTDYERVEATAKTSIDSESAGKQFIRIIVIGPDQ